ncbi:MAG: four helix bundle protein [Candidatus Terrybacteria bacterium]|nr:four helix bundle protein [Candidatus Terrybacteria bacterium]
MENNQLKSFKDLKVWQKSLDLSVLIYKITEKFPKEEMYGLISQMRRAAVSIPSNIAEGFKRNHKKEKLQFYNIAYSSDAELESQIEVAKNLKFLSLEDYQNSLSLLTEVSKMINGLIKSLNSKSFILNSNIGVATLPIVFVLAFFLLAVIVSIAAISFNESVVSQGAVYGSRALFFAEAGARDALIRISRNKNYSCSLPSTGCYQIDFTENGCSNNEGCAKITVSAEMSPKIIVSEGRIKNNIRKVQVNVFFDALQNGEITDIQWQEITE